MTNNSVLAALDKVATKGIAGFAWLGKTTERFLLVVLPPILSFSDHSRRAASFRVQSSKGGHRRSSPHLMVLSRPSKEGEK